MISSKHKGQLAAIAALLFVLLGASSLAAHEDDECIVVVIDEVRVGVLTSVPFEQFGFVDTSGDGMLDAEELSAQRESVAPTFSA